MAHSLLSSPPGALLKCQGVNAKGLLKAVPVKEKPQLYVDCAGNLQVRHVDGQEKTLLSASDQSKLYSVPVTGATYSRKTNTISAAMHMPSNVLKRMSPKDTISLPKSGWLLPGLPESVSKFRLKVISNWFLSFPGEDGKEYGTDPSAGCSFIEELCHLRHHV
ncbi:hypothetical protein AAG906_026349 [Vitis piasezkii]